jgi:transposase-like protein
VSPPVPAAKLVAGVDYPRNEAELRAWFATDDDCRDYLEWLRWPSGIPCQRCGTVGEGHRLADRTWWCSACRARTSVTAGTIFHRTRTPLTVWFAAAWHMTTAKNGVSAKTLHRLLGFGSYQTAWAMLHRYRRAMVRPGRDRLAGVVEVDETFIGGVKPGRPGRGAHGKVLVAIAVEAIDPKGFGRARLSVIPNATTPTLSKFLRDHIEEGATVRTDGWAPYRKACGGDYTHDPYNVSASPHQAHVVLPGVHRVASLVKRWLLGTHQGSVEGDHLQEYLDEWTFRFNRRHSTQRGLLFRRLLEQAVEAPPLTYAGDLVAVPRPITAAQKAALHPPPLDKRVHPPSIAIDGVHRPWRRAAS